MLQFFNNAHIYYAVEFKDNPTSKDIEKLTWLFGRKSKSLSEKKVEGIFLGTRREMITPWSTNAVEITLNMRIKNIIRMEMFEKVDNNSIVYDKMLQVIYNNLDQDIFLIDTKPAPILFIKDIEKYNNEFGLALSEEEIKYLKNVSKKLNRPLTDSELYGFSQINSEHCRHKIFRGTFIIDGVKQPLSLFALIKKTSEINPNQIVSAYTDNVAFIEGPSAIIFTPQKQDIASYFTEKTVETVISLKAETHNFPTTVEPFFGASTGSGGEIRDRMAGGRGSMPLAGTAVYCTSYPRLTKSRKWENHIPARNWLYQRPDEILIKASNGASDFGNKFGQPLICGSVLTFEHKEHNNIYGYDKVIMLAGGIGFSIKKYAYKKNPKKGDIIVVMGGDNYRIGMGGGSVSSVTTGEYENTIELNAVQRANPEMQKRVYNVIRALVEDTHNPIISVHDHGAGGHLNCLSELIENTGGTIEIDKLPVGDPSLSEKEIICNESQERMGLLFKSVNINYIKRIANRERAPIYEVGLVDRSKKLIFKGKTDINPVDLKLRYLLGSSPKTIIKDETIFLKFEEPKYELKHFFTYLRNVLKLESVACKDWLTNKVDRSVTGKIALQQTAGKIQLPLNNCGVVAMDYYGKTGIATSIGHAPIASLIDPVAGSVLAVAESLTNIVWAPLKHGLSGVSLSANWMWASNKKGESARLYKAVKSLSDFCIELGINVPTGKDSLFMTQKYPDGKQVVAPGTVIVSATAEVSDINKIIKPVLKRDYFSNLIYIRFTDDPIEIGGSAFYQTLGAVGKNPPLVTNTRYFLKAFATIQKLINNNLILSGHDIGSGGLITSLLEMCFPEPDVGMDINLSSIDEIDIPKILFSESPGVIIQTNDSKRVINELVKKNLYFYVIGKVISERVLKIVKNINYEFFNIDYYRDVWYSTSYHLDKKQSGAELAKERIKNYKKQPLELKFPDNFTGINEIAIRKSKKISTPKAAIIREKGVNGDREMAFSLYHAGFDVKDIHMTDLISGAENLEDINMIVFVGGFSNSDVLGSAKGWAGAFLYNPKAKKILKNFYKRKDTLSLGVCNGCQLMIELGLINPGDKIMPKMLQNTTGKFESAFLTVKIPENNSVMLKNLAGCSLGVWIAHGEGRFFLPIKEEHYHIPMKYAYAQFPGNPNGSDFATAGICSNDGRHLAIMPHIERSIFPWQWAYYPDDRKNDSITPWFHAFVNAREWVERLKG